MIVIPVLAVEREIEQPFAMARLPVQPGTPARQQAARFVHGALAVLCQMVLPILEVEERLAPCLFQQLDMTPQRLARDTQLIHGTRHVQSICEGDEGSQHLEEKGLITLLFHLARP